MIIIKQMFTKPLRSQLTIALLFLLVSVSFGQDIAPGSCIQYAGGTCIRCERETHLHNGICYTNILGCTQYADGSLCLQCDSTTFVLTGTTCSPLPGVTITPQLLASLYKYGGASELDPGSQYGEAGFMPISYEKVQKWPTFMALNTFIRVGQYSHFISRTGNPIYSVHYYVVDNRYSYKILYYGSGGGLFLCIADVPPTFKVQLRSLTPISSSNIIDFCIDYDTTSVCLRCATNYHLENRKCYPNFGGCVKYRENICLECMNYFFLVENRCISDCLSLSDARSLLYFEGSTTSSTLEVQYGLPLSQFYTITVTNTTSTVVTTFTNSNGGSSSGSTVGNNTSNTITRTSTTTSTTFSASATSSTQSVPLILPNVLGQDSSIDITPTLPGSLVFNTTTTTSSRTIASNAQDANCTFFGPDGLCIKCAPSYYKNKASICQAVSPFCATYSEETGACLTCFPGYQLNGRECDIAE